VSVTSHDRLRLVFAQSLDIDMDFDATQARLYETAGWDSMGHMRLVIAIEEEFDVELDADQIVEMITFSLAVEFLRELGCAI
jgi:acyl carrier protein